jgi:REP element-mobilizing transposase RayT
MARKQRIHYPGALYHVILRGNARQDIFFEDGDRCRFFLLLQEAVEKFERIGDRTNRGQAPN